MSKAFTRENDDSGLAHGPAGRARTTGPITAVGARLAREKLAEVSARLAQSERPDERAVLEVERERVAALASAPVGPHAASDVVAFGAQVNLRDEAGKERVVIVASPGEIGLVPHAASATSPIAQAILGAHTGDVVEFDGPRGHEELTIVNVQFPS
jgi:transcription elongation GreA/GreB family factor